MTVAAQLTVIFAFGLLVTGVVYLGLVRAREVEARASRVRAAAADGEDSRRP